MPDVSLSSLLVLLNRNPIGYFFPIQSIVREHFVNGFVRRVQPTRLLIYFKDTEFITLKRSELYGPTDFLANCGGLLGLFMGVSLLSIVEVTYYATLRLGCTLRNRIAAGENGNISNARENEKQHQPQNNMSYGKIQQRHHPV